MSSIVRTVAIFIPLALMAVVGRLAGHEAATWFGMGVTFGVVDLTLYAILGRRERA